MEDFGFETPKFNEDNFNLWKCRMTISLDATDYRSLQQLKSGSSNYRLDVKLKHMIAVSLPDNVFQSVVNCSTAKEMWDTLCLMYEGTESIKQMKKAELNRQYEAFSAKKGESVTETYNRFNRLLNDLRAVGIKRNISYVDKFVDALPYHWDNLVTSLRMNDSLPTLYSTLLYYEQLESRKKNRMFDTSSTNMWNTAVKVEK